MAREVSVIRLISEGTIEEDILRCAEAKLKLEQDLSQINSTYQNTEAHEIFLIFWISSGRSQQC